MYCSWCCHHLRYFIDVHYIDGNSDITIFIEHYIWQIVKCIEYCYFWGLPSVRPKNPLHVQCLLSSTCNKFSLFSYWIFFFSTCCSKSHSVICLSQSCMSHSLNVTDIYVMSSSGVHKILIIASAMLGYIFTWFKKTGLDWSFRSFRSFQVYIHTLAIAQKS